MNSHIKRMNKRALRANIKAAKRVVRDVLKEHSELHDSANNLILEFDLVITQLEALDKNGASEALIATANRARNEMVRALHGASGLKEK